MPEIIQKIDGSRFISKMCHSQPSRPDRVMKKLGPSDGFGPSASSWWLISDLAGHDPSRSITIHDDPSRSITCEFQTEYFRGFFNGLSAALHDHVVCGIAELRGEAIKRNI